MHRNNITRTQVRRDGACDRGLPMQYSSAREGVSGVAAALRPSTPASGEGAQAGEPAEGDPAAPGEICRAGTAAQAAIALRG